MRKLELACGVALSTLVLTGLSNNAFAAATLQCTQLAGHRVRPQHQEHYERAVWQWGYPILQRQH